MTPRHASLGDVVSGTAVDAAQEPLGVQEELDTAPAAGGKRRHPLQWVGEIVLLRVFEFGYMFVKDLAQSGGLATKSRAYLNGRRLVELERTLHLSSEPWLQGLFIGSTTVIRLFNLYYTTMHFFVTLAVLVWMYVRQPNQYSRARSILLVSSAVALIGYFAFPLVPPRLYYYECDCLVDTLDVVGGSLSYYSNQVRHLANPYAAMPSVHMTWALWAGLAMIRFGGRRLLTVIGVTHIVLTLAAIVVTGNHYWLDAVGGALVLAIGTWIVKAVSTWRRGSVSDGSVVMSPADLERVAAPSHSHDHR